MNPKKKPKGYFKFVLAIDTETTGLMMGAPDPSVGHQIVSIGLIVVDVDTLKTVEELYLEVKWNDQSKQKRSENPHFGKDAEKIHGLTYEYLEKTALTEEDAVCKVGALLLKYWGGDNDIRCLGHNVHNFDVPFLRAMFSRHGITLKFGNRHMDSYSVGMATFRTYNSDDLFSIIGFEERKDHNALDDAKMSLEVFRVVRPLWKNKVGLIWQPEDEENGST